MPKPLKFILILLLLVPPFLGFGQEQSVLEKFEKEIPFLVFKTQDANLNFQQVLASPDLFKSPNAVKEKTQSEDIYWIQLDFENLLSNESEAKDFYLKLNIFDYGSIFYQIDGATTEKPIGQFEESNIPKKIGTSYYYSFITLSTKNLIEDRYLLIKAQRITFNEDVNNWHFKRCISPPNEYMTTKDFFKQVIYYFFAGLCFIMWFSTLSFFLLLRNREYLYYSIYIVVTFIYLAGNKFGIYDLFLGNSYLKHNLSQSFLILGNLSYVLFVMSYLRTKRDYPGIHKVCKILVVLNIATLVLIGVFYSVDTVSIVMYSYEFTCAIALIAIIYLFLTSKNLLGRIIALASFAYSMGPLLRIYFVEPEDGLYLDGTYYLILGVSLEMVIFVFGLNYKFHLELRENFQLQQEAFVSKTKALRAQINPHFIFNSLSSIKHLVLQKDNKNAVKYLSKFSRLSRNILESSIETNATLSEEVKMLEDYLELESLRFDNAFSYSIKVDDTLNTSIIELPSMILQPFVENAIVHGLLPKEGTDKKLSINFMLDGNELVSVVEDNGVGRKQAIQRKHIYQKEKKSRGLEITKLRLESIVNDQDYLQIIDKVDNKNAPLGTKVVIKIPL